MACSWSVNSLSAFAARAAAVFEPIDSFH